MADWWMNNIPYAEAGRTDRIENNWWRYILIDARATRPTWKRLFRE